MRELEDLGAPKALVDIWARDIEELTEAQEKAVAAGALSLSTNLLIVAPTSSGKTFVAEMAAVAACYRTRRHTIFLVPYRALADEHFARMRERYADLLSVVIATGDWSEFDDDIRSGNFGLAILTYERMIGLLVDNPQILNNCGSVVIDEIQMLGDPHRGPALEMLITQLLTHPASPRIVALSASLDHLNKLDSWLDASLVSTNERPVPLYEGVLAPSTGQMLMADGSARHLAAGDPDPEKSMLSAVGRLVAEGKQVLVFCTSVPKTYSLAEQFRSFLSAPGLGEAAATVLDELEPSQTVETLRRTLASRVGFHNADLSSAERRGVESLFRTGECRVLVSTATLAMGVNLPSDVVFIAGTKQWFPDRGNWRSEDISVADYKNAAGRAGRLGQRTDGLAVIVSPLDVEQRQLLDYYCRGEVEPVESQLPRIPLDDVAFNVLCAGVAAGEHDLVDFISRTFAYETFYELHGGLDAVRLGVSEAVRVCQAAKLIENVDGALKPSESAYTFARRGIPVSAAVALAALADSVPDSSLTREEIVFAIASLDGLFEPRPYVEWDRLRHRPIDARSRFDFLAAPADTRAELSVALSRPSPDERGIRVLARSDCLLRWMAGESTTAISRVHAGCPQPRIATMGRTAAWLLDSVVDLLGRRTSDSSAITGVVLSMRYGLPAELAPLAMVRPIGIGRDAMMRLYSTDHELRLFDPDVLLDADDVAFDRVLTPTELARFRTAIVAERGESFRRRRDAHVLRAEAASLEARLVADLFDKEGVALEEAVADALASVGVPTAHVRTQHRGEEDLQITHPDGTIVVSVTASVNPSRHITWGKAREILGAGVGLNPAGYVCIGRPDFHILAVEHASVLAKEESARRLLLVPIPILAEIIVRCHEGSLVKADALNLLGASRGILTTSDLDAISNRRTHSKEGSVETRD